LPRSLPVLRRSISPATDSGKHRVWRLSALLRRGDRPGHRGGLPGRGAVRLGGGAQASRGLRVMAPRLRTFAIKRGSDRRTRASERRTHGSSRHRSADRSPPSRFQPASRRRESMKTAKISSLLFAVLLLPVVPIHAVAVSFNLSKVVDKTTPIPDGAGNFACLGNY